MRTPLKPLPETAARWMRRARGVRWLDAVAAWLALWAAIAALAQDADVSALAAVAAVLAAGGALIAPLREWWRPVSASVSLAVSRSLRPGDRAWWITGGEAELVLVTARRGVRVVIASLAGGPVEGVAVRRTHALLVPVDFPEAG